MHKVAVIGGDGIGPEVVAEALKVVAAAGRRRSTRSTTTSARRTTCGPARCCPTRSSTSSAASTPSCSARSARRSARPRCRRASSSGACCCGCASRSTSTSTSARSTGCPARSPRAPTSSSSGRTPRAPTRARAASSGGARRYEVATQGSVNTRHGVERCIRFAFELRRAGAGASPYARAQDERAHLPGRPVAADLRRGRGRPSRGRDRLQPRGRGLHLLRHRRRPLRRGGHRQPLRGHPHRPRRRGHRWHRARRLGEPEPGADRARRCSSRSTAPPTTSPEPARRTRWRRSARPR